MLAARYRICYCGVLHAAPRACEAQEDFSVDAGSLTVDLGGECPEGHVHVDVIELSVQ